MLKFYRVEAVELGEYDNRVAFTREVAAQDPVEAARLSVVIEPTPCGYADIKQLLAKIDHFYVMPMVEPETAE